MTCNIKSKIQLYIVYFHILTHNEVSFSMSQSC